MQETPFRKYADLRFVLFKTRVIHQSHVRFARTNVSRRVHIVDGRWFVCKHNFYGQKKFKVHRSEVTGAKPKYSICKSCLWYMYSRERKQNAESVQQAIP